MSETSRRKFIAAAGAGTAAVGAVAVSRPGAADAATPSADAAKDPVVAVVEDRSSVIRLLVGEDEVVVRDHDLATRIRNAAGGR